MKQIRLTRGVYAVVDDEDFELVSKYKWQCQIEPISGRRYATTTMRAGKKRFSVQMHRLILNHMAEHTDHVDGDGLNNRRCNIRPATRMQNAMNRKLQIHSAPYKGVSFLKKFGNWSASIRVNKVKKHLGVFDNPKTAAEAYDVAAVKYFGEFARTNKQIGAL